MPPADLLSDIRILIVMTGLGAILALVAVVVAVVSLLDQMELKKSQVALAEQIRNLPTEQLQRLIQLCQRVIEQAASERSTLLDQLEVIREADRKKRHQDVVLIQECVLRLQVSMTEFKALRQDLLTALTPPAPPFVTDETN